MNFQEITLRYGTSQKRCLALDVHGLSWDEEDALWLQVLAARPDLYWIRLLHGHFETSKIFPRGRNLLVGFESFSPDDAGALLSAEILGMGLEWGTICSKCFHDELLPFIRGLLSNPAIRLASLSSGSFEFCVDPSLPAETRNHLCNEALEISWRLYIERPLTPKEIEWRKRRHRKWHMARCRKGILGFSYYC